MPSHDDSYASGPAPSYGKNAGLKRPVLQSPPVAHNPQNPGRRWSFVQSDLLWMIACLISGLACAIALGDWLYIIVTHRVDNDRLAIVLTLIFLYALCIGGGWIWGKYQNVLAQTTLQQQVADLENQLARLNQTNEIQHRPLSPAEPLIVKDPGEISLLGRKPSPPRRAAQIYDQQLEPTDTSDLAKHPHLKYFPHSGEASSLDYGWQVIGASRRGYGHGYESKYREDDFLITILGEKGSGPIMAVVALADGVGSKKLSRRGALAVVQGATNLTERDVAPLKALLTHYRPHQEAELKYLTDKILLHSLQNARVAAERAARDSGVAVQELQTTLLVFLAAAPAPNQLFLGRVQIGDGAMFGLRADVDSKQAAKERWQPVLEPQIQAAGNEVYPFTESDESEWRSFLQPPIVQPFARIIATTDGIADDIEPPWPTPENPQPDPFAVIDRFHQEKIAPVIQSSNPAKELLDAIGYKKTQSIDDRTLVYLYCQ